MISSSSFSKREWWFALILVSVVQGVIWYVSFVNAGNQSALGYVSFAGTLISIILAVLAIGYTYGESIGQKNQGDSISSQIGLLSDVVRNIKYESESLTQISQISEELSKFSIKFDHEINNTKKQVHNVSKSIELLISNGFKGKGRNVEEVVETSLDKKELSDLFLSKCSPLQLVSILFVLTTKNTRFDDMTTTLEESVEHYIEEAKHSFTGGEHYIFDGVKDIFAGSALCLSTCLEGLQMLSNRNGEIVFSDEFVLSVKSVISKEIISKETFYEAIKLELLKDMEL
ncbi:hypothetical protein [Vibrio parahaemolyticus]|uniref:hypothetical protein n=1 Tax=Vibrio parahaemolyticus TaxID=670 RepID=UPI00301D906C